VAEPGYRALLIGSSTGGPEILTRILSRLPAPLPVPVLIAQHVLPNYEAGLALWLTRAGHQARVAVAGERPQAGVVYLGRGDHHLTLNAQGVFEEHPKQAEEACPSADALFKSAARACAGARLISVVLTGMGRDGAEGSVALRDAGAYTLAQALETCVVPSMPAEAIKAGGIREQLSPEEIAARIVALLRLTPPTPHL
ncbi:chemotaxis protein CheB, partial [Myxococcota bacterium]|nr:chemotaxis protein CheB [Myxococcota bacterium]